MKALNLTPWAHADVVMLGGGGYAPLRGFMTGEEYLSVVRQARLPDGQPWGLPVVLPVAVSSDLPEALDLHWQGHRIGTLHVMDAFALRPDEELKFVYGTRDTSHPGVAALSHRAGMALGGVVELHEAVPHSAAAVKAELAAQGWTSVAGFQTRNALQTAGICPERHGRPAAAPPDRANQG